MKKGEGRREGTRVNGDAIWIDGWDRETGKSPKPADKNVSPTGAEDGVAANDLAVSLDSSETKAKVLLQVYFLV